MPQRRTATILTAALLIVGAGRGASVQAADGDKTCQVSLSAGLNNTRPGEVRTKYTFGVAANTAESCADVTYVLVVTEQLPDGNTKVTELPGDVRVRNQTRIAAIEFDTDAKNTIKSFEPKLKTCTRCEAP